MMLVKILTVGVKGIFLHEVWLQRAIFFPERVANERVQLAMKKGEHFYLFSSDLIKKEFCLYKKYYWMF